ncbi:MAG: EpsG family protein [Bacteroidota bacterium]|nr:EpsG family protein [Bacteroidota bacterium]
MFFYIIYIIILLGFALNEIFNSDLNKKTQRNYIGLLCIILLIIHDGFRWETGTDWNGYYYTFLNSLSGSKVMMEPGYLLFNYAIRYITNNYTIFLIIHATIIYTLIIRTIFQHSVAPFLSILCLYCLMLPYLGMNRQYLAMAICIFSIRYIISRRSTYFIFCILIAMLFHISAVMFFIAYFLTKKISLKYFLILIIIAFVISFSNIINTLKFSNILMAGMVSTKSAFYIGVGKTTLLGSLLGTFNRLIWPIFVLLHMEKVKNKDAKFYLFLNISLISAILYIIFNGTSYQIIIARGLLYFNIFQIFLIPYIIYLFKNGLGRLSIFAILCIFYLSMTIKGIRSYQIEGKDDIFIPYKGIFINTEFERRVY